MEFLRAKPLIEGGGFIAALKRAPKGLAIRLDGKRLGRYFAALKPLRRWSLYRCSASRMMG